jgi:16S rRNA (guanine527-N7)-methyltransferase
MQGKIAEGLRAMGIAASEAQVEALARYLELLSKWNRVYNLTAITDTDEMVARHILDSLSILPFLPRRGRLLDVGTGAGLPGIPLAILLPGTDWVLLDSNGKKTRFVQQAVAELGLKRVKVVQARVQDYHAEASAAAAPFDAVLSRAYASLVDFAHSVQSLWLPGTRLMALKSEPRDEELRTLREQGTNIDIIRLRVPGIDAPRSLVILERQDS